MFKLISDPRVFPVRVVDLSGAANDVAAVAWTPTLGNRNLSFDRADGGRNVIFRTRRANVSISLRLVDHATVAQLQELAGLSASNRERVFCMVAPNLDGNTLLSAPLARSAKFWRRNASTASFEISSPTTVDLVGTRYRETADGYLEAVASGSPRFDDFGSGFGRSRGLRIEYNWPNLWSPSDPALSGTPLWSSGANAPTVVFDSTVESVVRGRVGATRVTSTSASPSTWTKAAVGVAQVGRVTCGVWLRGRASVRLGIAEAGGGGFSYSSPVSLDGSAWRYVTLSKVTAGTSGNFDVEVEATPTGAGSFELYHGPSKFSQGAASDVVSRGVESWSELASAQPEELDLGPFSPPRAFTLSLVGRVPRATPSPTQRIVAFSNTTAAVSDVYWTTSGIASRLNGATGPTAPLSALQFLNGRPYSYVLRFDPLADKWSAELAVLKADRTLHRDGQTIAIPSGADAIDAVSLRPAGGSTSVDGWGADAIVRDIRLDRRVWSDVEVERSLDFLLRDEWQNLRTATEGKLFELVDLSIFPVSTRWKDFDVEIALEEVDTLSNGELSFAI